MNHYEIHTREKFPGSGPYVYSVWYPDTPQKITYSIYLGLRHDAAPTEVAAALRTAAARLEVVAKETP